MIVNSNLPAATFAAQSKARSGKNISEGNAQQGADEAQLTPELSETDLTAAGPAIQDEDAAKAGMEQARQMIAAQNAMALRAQANSLPQRVLQLLQQ